MVQKKSKYGYNRGNTFCKLCRYRNAKETGMIYKFMFGNQYDKNNQREVNEALAQYLSDGGMQNNLFLESAREMYSLNKRKRWTLPSAIINAIDSGELDDLDLSLAMHERSSVPFRSAWRMYAFGRETKASSLSYHNSKSTIHHMFPNPKSRVSSLTDLKLNCHLGHNVAESNPMGCNTTQRSKKYHTRGVQRMQTSFAERHNGYNFRDVMMEMADKIREPEVRYEILYPDVFNRYCRCIKYRDTRYNSRRFEESTLSRWKRKGCRAKPSMQEYYKGIDNLEKRLLTSDFIREMDEDNDASITNEIYDEMYQNDEDGLVGRQTISLADFCDDMTRPSSKQNRNRSSKTKDKTNSCYNRNTYCVNGDQIGQRYGKGNVIYIDTKEEIHGEVDTVQNSSTSFIDDTNVDIVTNEDTGSDMLTQWISEVEFERQFCRCVIDKESIEDAISTNIEFDVQMNNCVPQQLLITIKGETCISRMLLWQRSEWFPDQAEFWIKVQFESDGSVVEMASDELKAKMKDEKETVLSLYQIAEIVKREAANKFLINRCQKMRRKKQPTGHLTASVADPSFVVRTVHEAYETLLTEEDDTLRSFELVDRPIPSELDICETCFCESYDPQMDGCTLLPCRHYFCIDCWRQHITIRIKERAANIPCQAFKCNELVDDVMVHALVSCDLNHQWITRKKERMLESQSWHRCPTRYCNKFAMVTTAGSRFSGDNVPVLCDCDRVWCFSCQSDVHWPATCEQHLNYRKTLSQNGHTGEGRYTDERHLYYVEVKKCPMCKYPIEKNGGCPQMTCRCSHEFCWECLRDRSSHIDGVRCQADSTCLITMTLDDTEYSIMHRQSYMKCVGHRYKWTKTFSGRAIAKRLKVLGISSAYKTKQVPSISIEEANKSTNEEVRSSLVFIREVYLVLENTYVMLSFTLRRKLRDWTLLDDIEFCLYQMEHILSNPKLIPNDLRRISRLRSSIESRLRILPRLTTTIQRDIQAAKEKRVMTHTGSTYM